jgi:hypothetical protein
LISSTKETITIADTMYKVQLEKKKKSVNIPVNTVFGFYKDSLYLVYIILGNLHAPDAKFQISDSTLVSLIYNKVKNDIITQYGKAKDDFGNITPDDIVQRDGAGREIARMYGRKFPKTEILVVREKKDNRFTVTLSYTSVQLARRRYVELQQHTQ